MEEAALKIKNFDELVHDKICYWQDSNKKWLLYLPGCGVGGLGLHKVEENVDGTITVTPSILVTGHNEGNPIKRHGFLTKGIWREV